jgi:hypothetical protein
MSVNADGLNLGESLKCKPDAAASKKAARQRRTRALPNAVAR